MQSPGSSTGSSASCSCTSQHRAESIMHSSDRYLNSPKAAPTHSASRLSDSPVFSKISRPIPPNQCCEAAHSLLYRLELCHSARNRSDEGLRQVPPQLLNGARVHACEHMSRLPLVSMQTELLLHERFGIHELQARS